ncbi:MAG: hypothetical protein ACXABY_07065 [Candidatus Thorarchaeota archaeon]|jgi:hypothetical protein
MIAIVFYLEDSTLVHDSVEQVMSRRTFDSRMLGATHLFMIDKTQYRVGQYYDHADGEIEFGLFESLGDVMALYSSEKFVYLENESSFAFEGVEYSGLKEYVHPDSCIYVTGPDTGVENILVNSDVLDPDYVSIDVQNVWSETAVNIVLYDRKTK